MNKSYPNQEGTRDPNHGHPGSPGGGTPSPGIAGESTRADDTTVEQPDHRPVENPDGDAVRAVAEGTHKESVHASQASAGAEASTSVNRREEQLAVQSFGSLGPRDAGGANEAATVETSTSASKSDRRVEPQNLAEFIDAFVAGKAKSLSSATARRLMGASAIEPAVRGQLLRRAQETDPTLEKTRKLMLLGRENRAYRTLSQLLMEFCVECVVLNPAVRATGMKTMLFPGFEDESSLEDAWRLLQSLSVPEQLPPDIQQSGTSPEHDDPARSAVTTDDRASGGREPKGGKERTPGAKAAASRSRRNALLCSAIWRMHHGQTSFAEMMRSLRATVFALRERPQSLESELFEAIATLPEKEDERLAYVLEWSARQQAEGLNRLADAVRQAEALQSQVTAAEEQLRGMTERAAMLERQLEAERTARAAADKAVGVAQTHGQADLEEVRAMSLRAIRDAIAQLDVVSAALKREFPKVDSARDKVDSVMDALKSANKKLEEA
ncbi:hypothetical protein AB4Y44_35860 [Paraburkholderia sp. BR10937]|uniref:hypothetical protein n=1 Tax=Paraburkholderia sp. BR10937 TaxID=3236994 RepID=UPI0034D30DDD